MPDTSCSKRPRPNGPEPDNTANPSKKQAVRKRAPLACEECRMRKRRCDGAVPICGGCTKRMSSCVYLAELQEKAWHHDMIKTLRNRLSELERADQQRQERDEIQSHHDDTIIVNNQDRSPRESGAELELSVSGCNQPSNHGQMLARPASSIAQHGNAVAVPAHTHTPILTSSVPVNLATPSGSPSATSGGLEPGSVERLMRPIDQAIGRRSPDKDDISIPSITRSIPAATGPERNNPRPPCFCHQLLASGQWSLPLRRQADDLVRLYFSRVHRMYPILHKPTFIKQYRQLWEPAATPSPTPPGHGPPKDQCSGLCRQKSRDKTFPAMVNAVFALASLFASGPPEENSARAGSFFSQAQQIDLLDIIDEEVGIELVQLLLLMGFYLQSTERFSKCWNITGLAIRMAQNMGLQLSALDARRKGLLVSSPTQLESEMRVRVWYGCVLLDREISMSFGRPLMVHSSGERLGLPQAIDDEYLNDEPGASWNSQPRGRPSLLESYIQTINLYDIMGQVLDREQAKDASVANLNLDWDTQSLLDLDAKIMEWRGSLPPYLQYEPPQSPEDGAEEALAPRALLAGVDTRAQTDFVAQAKRLHARFLHVRVLILRPALEHLFQKQRNGSSRAQPQPQVKRVQDIMLSSIAALCVLSADSLVKCLAMHIQSQSLVAWWYNVGYLHTSGSTLLMGQLCKFDDTTVLDARSSLSESWKLCMECLARYKSLSSIASKSFNLLQESARRLVILPSSTNSGIHAAPQQEQSQQQTVTGIVSPARMISPRHASINTTNMTNTCTAVDAHGSGQEMLAQEKNGHQLQHHLLDPALLNSDGPRELAQMVDPYNDDSDGARLDDQGHDSMWIGNTGYFDSASSGNAYWPFMPFLSQLESLPQDFDISGLEP